MTDDQLTLLREWIKAEIAAQIADAQPGSDGYFGTGYNENKHAESLFEQVRTSLVTVTT